MTVNSTMMTPGSFYVSPVDPMTNSVCVTNSSPTAATFSCPGGAVVSVPGTSTLMITLGTSGNVVAVPQVYGTGVIFTTTAPRPVMMPVTIAPPTPPAPTPTEDDLLFPKDELVFADNPITLTEDNKSAIRDFVMELPKFSAMVKKAREKLRAAREALSRKKPVKHLYTNASQKLIEDQAAMMKNYCDQHQQQMEKLLREQEDQLNRNRMRLKLPFSKILTKWISTQDDSRSSVAV